MFAYIDESGNTGANLFDPDQPYFCSVAMTSPTDFDIEFGEEVDGIARGLGVERLHANEIKLDGLSNIADSVVNLIVRSQVRFHYVFVDKVDAAVLQFFNAIFDPGENPAVPSEAYWISHNRSVMALQFASNLSLSDVMSFWELMISVRSEESDAIAQATIDNVINRVVETPDSPSQRIITEGLNWARDNIGSFSFWSPKKKAHHVLLPNLFGLPGLFHAVADDAVVRGTKVECIIHDRQSQFGADLRTWYSMFRGIDAGTSVPFGDQILEFPDISQSSFELKDSNSSPGLQIADVALWVFMREKSGTPLPENIARLHNAVHSVDNVIEISLRWLCFEVEVVNKLALGKSEAGDLTI